MRYVLAALALFGAGFFLGSLTPVGRALAQALAPSSINGCIYQATPPTLANKQSTIFTCDVNGNLRVH